MKKTVALLLITLLLLSCNNKNTTVPAVAKMSSADSINNLLQEKLWVEQSGETDNYRVLQFSSNHFFFDLNGDVAYEYSIKQDSLIGFSLPHHFFRKAFNIDSLNDSLLVLAAKSKTFTYKKGDNTSLLIGRWSSMGPNTSQDKYELCKNDSFFIVKPSGVRIDSGIYSVDTNRLIFQQDSVKKIVSFEFIRNNMVLILKVDTGEQVLSRSMFAF